MRFSVYIVCPSVLKCSNLKLHQTSEVKNIFKQEKIMLQLTFNPGLMLTGFRTTRPRFLQPISGDFVSRSIRVLKTNRAVGLDKIGARLLKDSVDVITPSLTNLEIIVNFNKMLETLIFQRSYAQYLY